jgi:molybdopterin-guanine dinucleotide biosynthesis protein A
MDLGPVAGLLLAGGRSSRLGGGDKALQVVAGRRLLDRVIERAAPQVCCLLLNANGDPDRFLSYGLPVIADGVGDHWGPLAGVLAGFRRLAETRPDIAWMATFATDTPLFPLDLVARLAARLVAEGADLAVAASAGRTHPVFALWPLRLAQPLHHALVDSALSGRRGGLADGQWRRSVLQRQYGGGLGASGADVAPPVMLRHQASSAAASGGSTVPAPWTAASHAG